MKFTVPSVVALALLAGSAALAQDAFPSRPINLIVSNSAGTAPDVLARLYADRMSKTLGQSVVVVPRPGGGGIIGAQVVATAPADGYTLLLANSAQSILGTLRKDLSFDPVKSFAGVSMVAEAPLTLVVSKTLGVQTLPEFVALAKQKPGTIAFGTAGYGSISHLAGEYFSKQAGIELLHVPYSDLSTLGPDLLTGRTGAVFSSIPFTLPYVRENRLVALMSGGPEAMTTPIHIPNAKSQGINYEYASWYGILAPAKTPPQIMAALAKAAEEASRDPAVRGSIEQQGLTNRSITLKAFDDHIQEEMGRLAPILADIGAKMKN